MIKNILLKSTFFSLFVLTANFLMAQATRTWVSGVGDDVNPCSRTAPCKTFAGAISKTATGGEISILDPGGFGAVTITKSITIDGGGIIGSILASFTNGIIINAVDAVVTLRHLSINGAGSTLGTNGIKIIAGKKVIIEDCTISNFSQKGIEINTTNSCTVFLNNVTIHNTDDAVAITNTNGAVIIDDCTFQMISNNGINLLSGMATVSNTKISDCKTGVSSHTNTTINLSNNVITHNETGVQSSGKLSAANNTLVGNKTQGNISGVIKMQ